MASKKGRTRKQDSSTERDNDAIDPFTSPIDRENWSGWVEMESEPAFFNVMLKEMGVKGVKIQEVYSLDDSMLATLPQPIHALIFLFQYKEADWTDSTLASCPKDVWFANQTPDFACATFAMLNIVNNIPEVRLGAELQAFKTHTQDMNPLTRGDAIDNFTFVKKIHNSFASENDVLQADMFVKSKSAKLKRLRSAAKGRETKAANRAANSKAQKKDLGTNEQDRRSDRVRKFTSKYLDRQDFEYKGKSAQNATETPRRSSRSPRLRARNFSCDENANDLDRDDEGFHFVAYMPIAGHVWKLDGLDRFPEDMGEYTHTTDWWTRVRPALISRMKRYEGAEIEFNLMAVVRDNIEDDRTSLLRSIRAVQGLDVKLHLIQGNVEEARKIGLSRDLLTSELEKLGVTKRALAVTIRSPQDSSEMDAMGDNIPALLDLRTKLINQQSRIKAAIRESLETEKQNEEKARHRRHNYSTFVRQWLQVLANRSIFDTLLSRAIE